MNPKWYIKALAILIFLAVFPIMSAQLHIAELISLQNMEIKKIDNIMFLFDKRLKDIEDDFFIDTTDKDTRAYKKLMAHYRKEWNKRYHKKGKKKGKR